jgi:hypothetical protein
MGFLLAAVAAAAALLTHSGTAAAAPQTLLSISHPVAAFAQDGQVVAWFAPGDAGRCNTVHLLKLDNGVNVDLPSQTSQNVTCHFARSTRLPVALAVARQAGRALWTLPQESPLPLDYLLGGGVEANERAERRFLEIAHTPRGVGQWFGGVAGDADTLVYAVTSVDFADEGGCLAGTAPCTLVRSGGGVYRTDGRASVHVPGTNPAVAVAASGDAVAYVAANRIGDDGRPRASAGLPIEIVDVRSGQELTSVRPQGVPAAIAMSPNVLATLERTRLGLRLAWYDRATGHISGSIPVPKATAPQLTTSDRVVVYRVGRTLRGVSTASHRVRLLARAATAPIGLSLEGTRLAWAENIGRTARIRALYVRGSG